MMRQKNADCHIGWRQRIDDSVTSQNGNGRAFGNGPQIDTNDRCAERAMDFVKQRSLSASNVEYARYTVRIFPQTLENGRVDSKPAVGTRQIAAGTSNYIIG